MRPFEAYALIKQARRLPPLGPYIDDAGRLASNNTLQRLWEDQFDEPQKQAALKKDFTWHDHQADFRDHLIRNDGQAVMAHGVGTGKTPTSIGGFETLKRMGKAKTALVVVPAALVDNYHDQIGQFTDSSAVKYGPKGTVGAHHPSYGPARRSDYHVISNELFRQDPHKILDHTGADTIIWDEAHKGRDDRSLNYGAMKTVRPRVKNFMALTGTPVVNHPHDLVPLIDIVTNGKHGLGTVDQFDKHHTASVTKIHGSWAWAGIGPQTHELMLKNTEHLKHELNKHIHYVPVEDVAKDMPKKTIHNVDVEMSGHQKSLYDFTMDQVDPYTRAKIRNNVPVSTSEAKGILSKIIRTRQLSNSVHTLDSQHDAASGAEATPKMKRMLDDVHAHLSANPKHKAIVYTNLVRGGIDAVSAGLKARGHDHGLFIGSTNQKKTERTQHVKDYLSGAKRVMVINSAGNEGLNLPGTTAHFTTEPHWNHAVLEQAEARGIRSGSPVKEVHVYRYRSMAPKPLGFLPPMEASVDQWVSSIADRKRRLNNQVIDLLHRKSYTGVPAEKSASN